MTAFEEVVDDPRIAKEVMTLTGAGYSVDLLCVRYRDSAHQPPYFGAERHTINVGRVRRGKLRFLRFYARAPLVAIRLKAAVYHAQDLYSLPAAWLAAAWNSATLIYETHEYFAGTPSLANRLLERSIWRIVERAFIRRADAVITVCNSIADRLSLDYRVRKPLVLRNLPLESTTLPTRSSSLRCCYGIPPDRTIVLYQGALMKGRGLPTILDVFEHNLDDRYHLAVIGDGPLGPDLHRRADTDSLRARVTFCGRIPMQELPSYTASADIALCLIEDAGFSYLHSLPNKLFEYIAAGIPVVASDFPEIGTVVRDTQSGLLVDPADREAIAKAIVALSPGLEGASDLHGRCVLNARLAAPNYTWEKESERLLDLYRRRGAPGAGQPRPGMARERHG